MLEPAASRSSRHFINHKQILRTRHSLPVRITTTISLWISWKCPRQLRKTSPEPETRWRRRDVPPPPRTNLFHWNQFEIIHNMNKILFTWTKLASCSPLTHFRQQAIIRAKEKRRMKIVERKVQRYSTKKLSEVCPLRSAQWFTAKRGSNRGTCRLSRTAVATMIALTQSHNNVALFARKFSQ